MNTVGQQPMDGWHTTPWKKIEWAVCKLHKRMYRAQLRGDVRQGRSLQRLLVQSRSARFLAVRQGTQDNQGKKTAGVDGVKARTPAQRLALVKHLSLHQKATPVRRGLIPQPASEAKQPFGMPTLQDRVLQA